MKPDDVSFQTCAPCKNVLNEICASLLFLGLAATLTSLTVGSNTPWPCPTSSTTRWGLSLVDHRCLRLILLIFFCSQTIPGLRVWTSWLKRTIQTSAHISAPQVEYHQGNLKAWKADFPNFDLAIFSGTLARSEWDWRRLHGKPHLWGDLGKVTYTLSAMRQLYFHLKDFETYQSSSSKD